MTRYVFFQSDRLPQRPLLRVAEPMHLKSQNRVNTSDGIRLTGVTEQKTTNGVGALCSKLKTKPTHKPQTECGQITLSP